MRRSETIKGSGEKKKTEFYCFSNWSCHRPTHTLTHPSSYRMGTPAFISKPCLVCLSSGVEVECKMKNTPQNATEVQHVIRCLRLSVAFISLPLELAPCYRWMQLKVTSPGKKRQRNAFLLHTATFCFLQSPHFCEVLYDLTSSPTWYKWYF